MPEGKIIPASAEEYPELKDLPMGAKVSFSGEATYVEGGLQVDQISLEPSDNEATRELNKAVGGNQPAYSPKSSESSGF